MSTPASSISVAESVYRQGQKLIDRDPYLAPYRSAIERRLRHTRVTAESLADESAGLSEIAVNHHYFGLHRENREWVFREWAPHATAVHILGEMTDWRIQPAFALERIDDSGLWEIRLPAEKLDHGDLYRLHIRWPGGEGDRIPAYARRVVQDPETLIFNAQAWNPPAYQWQCPDFQATAETIFIYEAHVGMAQEEGRVGTYREFADTVLPRIAASGYNALQLMAVQEHPYYGSFGYHVSSFFAASSRFGPPEDLKYLVDKAHDTGLLVIMDIVHSHAVNNEVEGLSRFDGTLYQYFHDGPRGFHHAWDSRCFDYSKPPVLRFLLSNCRFWLEEYRFDGFRFDGITSMLYQDHGLEKAFTSYDDYFTENVDEAAITYLTLANRVIQEIRPGAVTIAEDISGLPGLALPEAEGGLGFDFRLAMGVPDFWIKLVKEYRDENWPLGQLWYELINRRAGEKSISYVESHDQALVGDQTLIFRLIGSAIYDHMHIRDEHPQVDRGTALHKMIRLITLATAGQGYQNFMGNEFGHPEWIDFPREGNHWSYHYARRQWSLADNPELKYQFLERFDRDIVNLARSRDIYGEPWPWLLYEHNEHKLLVFQRGGLLFAFNFHPTASYADYAVPAPAGKYRMIFDSDAPEYGGHNRLTPGQVHFTRAGETADSPRLSLYLPSRTALVLEPAKA